MAVKPLHRLQTSYQQSISPIYIQRLCTSWLLPPAALATLRALLALYIFTTIFTVFGLNDARGNSEDTEHDFSYFTFLSYWGLAFYFAFAAAHTASYALRGRAWLEGWPAWLRWAHSALYVTVTVYPFVVTVVFWAVLASGAFRSPFTTWSNISEHALNSVFAFAEIVLPCSEPHPWIQTAPIVVVAALYLALAYVTQASEGFYVYYFLDPAHGRGLVAGACIGILAAMIIFFVVVRYLILLRMWITEKRLGMTGKLSKRAIKRSTVVEDGHGEAMGELSKTGVRTVEEA